MIQPNMPEPKPIECLECGSTFFYEADFRQYQVYPSAFPGGALSPSNHACSAKICLCGQLLLPGIEQSRSGEVGKSFQQSIRAAQEQRARISPDRIKADLARDLITQTEFQAATARLQALEAILEQIRCQDQVSDQKTQC
jgi:hypothetical protein